MTGPRDEAADLAFKKAGLDHLRASVSGRLSPLCVTVDPEALAAVRAAAQVAGETQGAVVSMGIALAVQALCRREGADFASVFGKRQAENLKTLGGPSCPAPEKK
jgi:hypothetical protein